MTPAERVLMGEKRCGRCLAWVRHLHVAARQRGRRAVAVPAPGLCMACALALRWWVGTATE